MPTPELCTRMPSVESAERAFADLHAALLPDAVVVVQDGTKHVTGPCGRITVTKDWIGLTVAAGRKPAAALLVWHMAPGTPEGRERLLERLRKSIA